MRKGVFETSILVRVWNIFWEKLSQLFSLVTYLCGVFCFMKVVESLIYRDFSFVYVYLVLSFVCMALNVINRRF